MLTHATVQTLRTLSLPGMAEALAQQLAQPDLQALSFEERLGLLVDREVAYRENRRLTRLLQQAHLKVPACVEDSDYRHPRGLKHLVQGDPIDAGTFQRHRAHLTRLQPGDELGDAPRRRRKHRHVASRALPRGRTHPMLLTPDVDPRDLSPQNRKSVPRPRLEDVRSLTRHEVEPRDGVGR